MRKINKKKVIIMGGGLAGLACAYTLTKAGHQVTVVEQEKQVGGLARTIEVNGFRFDTGPHRWYSKNDMVNNWMLSLMGNEVIKVPRLTRIYFDKKFFNYPIKIKSTLQGMGVVKTVMAVIDYLLVRLINQFRKKNPVTLEDGFVAQFGWTLYRMFFKRYSEKLWGVSCRKISADWIGQRTRGFNFLTVIKDTLFGPQKVASFVDEFLYPKCGIGRIAEKMAKEIENSGGKILLNTKVEEVETRGKKIATITVVKNNAKNKLVQKLRADEFVSSIALSDMIKMMKPLVPKEIQKANHKLTYRDEVQVALFIKKTKITPDTWIYVHSLELPYVRFMEMDNWSDKLSPKGTTTLVFEITCNNQDKIWKMSDKQLINLVTESFIKEFHLIKKTDIIDAYVHRIPKEYPIYHIGYNDDLKIIKNYLKRFTNLQIIGRNGIFRYNNMDHSIEMGLYAAWNIIENERKFDIESVNIEREYLEEKRGTADKITYPEDEKVE